MVYNSEQIILIIIIINTVIALLYMLIMYKKTKLPYTIQRGVIMLICPVTGVFCYFFSFLIGLFLKDQEVDYENLSLDKTKKEFLQNVNKQQEMEVIPLEEVLTVAVPKDRRRAMMNLLKLNVSENISLVRKAVENEDSETAHYAAAALSDAFSKFSVELNELQVAYDKDRGDKKINMTYMDKVIYILQSGGMIGVEETKYNYLYINLFLNLNATHPESITADYYEAMVNALNRVGRTHDAEQWAEKSLEEMPDVEQSYLNVMKMKYILGKKEFYDVLERLMSSKISLSNKGLEIVRFWIKK